MVILSRCFIEVFLKISNDIRGFYNDFTIVAEGGNLMFRVNFDVLRGHVFQVGEIYFRYFGIDFIDFSGQFCQACERW